MTDIMPSSILELAQTVSQGTDEIITVIMSQNTGSSSRYALFDPLGDDVTEQLLEEDIAYRRFTDQAEMFSTLERLADTIGKDRRVTAEIISFGRGQVVDASRFNMD